MGASHSRPWVGAALLAGVAYFLIGRWFPQPANHLEAWRLAAWAASGVVYAAHIGYEQFRLSNPPRRTASHAALAVAWGALALALAGTVHAASTTAGIRPAWLLAIVLWPAMTAVPAFLVAYLAAVVLARVPR